MPTLDYSEKYKIYGNNIYDFGSMLYIISNKKYKIVHNEKKFKIIMIKNNGKEKTVFECEKIENLCSVEIGIGDYVGLLDIQIMEDNTPVDIKPVYVLSEKIGRIYSVNVENIDELIKKNEHFVEKLTKDIVRNTQRLEIPFSLYSQTDFPVSVSSQPPSRFFAYYFIKKYMDDITQAYNIILKNPHRNLVQLLEERFVWEISEVSVDTILSMIRYPGNYYETEFGIPANGTHYIPEKVMEWRKYVTYDTLENRFAKYFLEILMNYAFDIVNVYEKYDSTRTISNFINFSQILLGSYVFRDVGEMTVLPERSQVLLRREGYKEILYMWNLFRSEFPSFREMENAIASKDLPRLYEYWCLFQLIDTLKNVFGTANVKIVVTPEGYLNEHGKIYVEFEDGWKLYYNKRIDGYSLQVRPDFLLIKKKDKDSEDIVGVFDAKFKLTDENVFLKELLEEEDIYSEDTKAKLEDIYKMHAYRDSLHARFAIILYPGNTNVFYTKDKKKLMGREMSIKDIFNDELEGVGYYSMIPR